MAQFELNSVHGSNTKSMKLPRTFPEDCVGHRSRGLPTMVTATVEQDLHVIPNDCQALLQLVEPQIRKVNNEANQYTCFMYKFGCLNQGLKLAERLNKTITVSIGVIQCC